MEYTEKMCMDLARQATDLLSEIAVKEASMRGILGILMKKKMPLVEKLLRKEYLLDDDRKYMAIDWFMKVNGHKIEVSVEFVESPRTAFRNDRAAVAKIDKTQMAEYTKLYENVLDHYDPTLLKKLDDAAWNLETVEDNVRYGKTIYADITFEDAAQSDFFKKSGLTVDGTYGPVSLESRQIKR